MNLGLKNKIAVVAAASQGLGKASALALASEGATVVICSRREQEIHQAASEIERASGSVVVPLVADVSKKADIEQLVGRVMERFGTVHVLVNNAGGPPTGNIETMTDEEWLQGFELTLMSAVRLTRAVLKPMVKQQWGRVITITSFTAKQPVNELLISSTIRPGISGMTKVLSNLYAKHNITINSICPGNILTKRQEELSASRAASRKLTKEQYLEEAAREIPTGRLGRPEEIGNVVAFLASEQASYINGINLLVDGGLTKGIH